MAQDNLTAYAQWLVQNKDKKGTPEFDKVARAFQMLQAAGPRQAEAPVNPPGTGVGRSWQRGVIGTKQGIYSGIATNAANTLESMDVDRLTTIRRALDIVVPEDALAMMEADGTLQALGSVRNEEELNRWFDSLDRDFDLGPQNVAKLKAMVGGAEAAKSDYRAPGGKFETVRETGQDALTRASELEADRAALPMSPVAQRGAQDFQDAEGVMDWARKSFKDPMAALAFIGETAAETGPAMAAGIGTSVVTGNPLLGAGIMIAASTPREYGGEVISFLREQDINVSDPQAIREAIDNGNIMAEAQKRGLTKAAIISAFEAIGMKGGGGILLQGGKQAFTGGAGEATSQVALDGEITSAKEVALEAVAELATTPGEAAILYTKNGTLKDPDSLDDTQRQAAGDLARTFKAITDANPDFNLKDVDKTSAKGARAVVDQAHIQLTEALKQRFADMKSRVKPNQTDTFESVSEKILAAAAYREGRNKTKSIVGNQELDALKRLAGDTREGQEAVNLILQLNQLTELHNSGYQGGLSSFTDQFSVFGSKVGYDKGAVATERLLRPLISGGAAVQTGGLSIPAQMAVSGGGRAIDKLTGNYSQIDKFVRRNAETPGLQQPTAPSLRDAAAAQLQADEDAKQREEALRTAREAEQRQLNLQLAQQDAPATPGSPQFTMEDATGLSRDGVARILRVLKGRNDNPALTRAIQEYEQSVATGGRIEDLSPLIRAVRQFQQDNPEYVPMVRPPNSLSNPMLANPAAPGQPPAVGTTEPNPVQAQTFGPQFTTQENYNRGIEANKAMNAELVEGVTTDPELNRVQKGRLITSLDVLANNLGSDPVAAAQEQVQKLEEAGVPAEAVEKYIQPYVDRVARQQAARDVGPRMAMAPQEDAPANADLWSVPPQAFNSADTSINSGKLPAGFTELKKQGVFEEGQTVVDIGGGRFDNAVEDLAKQGVTLKVYDPFNRSAMHNETVVSEIANGGAYAAVSNNVLNVIQEPENINRVVRQAHNAIPDGGKAYFTVYEGKGDGVGTETSKGWQRNEKTQDYVARIEEVFGPGNVTRKGKVITATKATSASPIASAIQTAPGQSYVNPLQVPDNEIDATRLNDSPSEADIQKMREGTYKPKTKRNLVEAADYMYQKWKAATGRDEPFEYTPENVDIISTYMATEAVNALQSDANAIGWYDRKLKAAKRVVSLVDPRVTQSADAEAAFDFALAVTSNGQAVADNFAYAHEVFGYFMDNGVMPTTTWKKGGERNASMVEAFDFFNAYQASGTNMPIQDFLDSDFTVNELNMYIARFNEQYGTEIKVPSSEGANAEVKGSYVIGPKIGQGFYQNIRGNYDPLTMDIWWMRMWNRLVGRPFVADPDLDKGRVNVRDAMKGAGKLEQKMINQTLKEMGVGKREINKDSALFDDFVTNVEKKYQKFYKQYKIDNGVNHNKPNFFKKTGTHVKNLKPQLQAQPKGPNERAYMREVTKAAIAKLADLGYDIETADFQALMWYPEKQLFRHLGVAPGRGADNDYLDAAIMLAESEGITNDQIQEALPDADGDGAVNNQSGAQGVNERLYRGPSGDGEGQTRAAIAPVTDGVAGILASRLAGGPTQRSSVPSTQEVKQAAEPVRAIIEVGKKGSKYEDGIKDINQVRELADAINVALKMYSDQRKMRFDANAPNSTDAMGLYEAGNAYALDPQAAGSEFQSYITALHEVAHGLNDQRYNPALLSSFDEDVQQELMGKLAGYPGPMTNKLTGRKEYIRRGSFDEFIGAMLSGGSKVPKDLQKMVLKEMKDLQDQGQYRDGTDVRYKGGTKRTLAQRKSTPYYKYIRSTPEMAVDPVIYYLHDPKGMKKNYPATAEMIKSFFSKSPKIQFYSHPLAMAFAVALAILMKAEQEDEQEKQMPPGALNQPMMPGALSA